MTATMRSMSTSDITLTFKKGEDHVSDQIAAVPHRASAFDLVASQPWAITPDMLHTISTIARRENESVETLEARAGHPLQNTRLVTMRGSTAIIPITGPIFRYGNMFTRISGATSLDVLAQEFNSALENPAVKDIVLNLDTPGGQANGIAEFAAMVHGAGKPVTAFIENAASAGYWIASAASRVVISKTGEAGSIGAVVAIDTTGNKPGVIEIVSSQSPKKRPDVTTDAGRAQIQTRVDQWAAAFISDVAANRNTTVEDVLARFGQGDMKMGQAAVDAGMADKVATLEAVIAGLSGTTLKGAKTMANEDTGVPAAAAPAITREYLAAHHPELVAALQGEGATAERSRMLDVQAQCQAIPGHGALMAQLMADGVTTGPMAAVAILAAEKALAGNRRSAIEADRIDPVPHAAAPDAAAEAAAQAAEDAALPVEARCEKQWNASAELRGEFQSLGAYTAFVRNEETGRARVFKK